MKNLFLIIFLLKFNVTLGQYKIEISGKVLDEMGHPINNAWLIYDKEKFRYDTIFTDKNGQFNITCLTSQGFRIYLHLEKAGYLPKIKSIEPSSNNISLKEPIVLRNRRVFWYDSRQIDSTHLGITIGEAIKMYKLDTSQCFLLIEPIGTYRGFRTEFADSSEVFFSIKSFFSKNRITVSDILDKKIIGFGVADTTGNEKIIGAGFILPNPYYVEQVMKENDAKSKSN